MWRAPALAVCMGLSASGAICLGPNVCEDQIKKVVDDIRERVADTLQAKTEDVLGVAPSAVKATEQQFKANFLSSQLSAPPAADNTAAQRNEGALLEHFWYQLEQNPELDWVYFGYEKDNEFLGLRKAWACEAGVNTCNYGTGAVKDCVSVGAGTRCPSLTPGVSVVRMQGQATLNVHSTEAATGSDAKVQLYHQTWNTKGRPWYQSAAAATADAAGNYPDVWTDPYVFSGGVIGVTVARPVYDGATLLGVLAADYELTFLKTFINSIALGSGQQVFMMTTDGTLLATSDATVSVTAAGSTRKTSAVGGLIADAATAAFAAQSSFSSKTASWSTLGTSITTGTFNSGGVSHKFDAIGVTDPRWIVVIAEKAQQLYVADKDSKLLCVLDTTCRNVLLSANYDLRERSVRHFSSRVKTYLGTALAAVLTLDTSYNMGNLHDGWCATCGKLDWVNDVERKNVRRHIKDVLSTYAEVSWLYLGFYDTTDSTKGKIAGYRRSGSAVDAWLTCDAATEECSQSGSSNFFSEAADGSLTFKEAYQGDFYAQNWFKYGASLNLQYDQVAWTDPYVFGDGDVGITLVRKAFDGDFKSSSGTGMGVWGADFTLSFLGTFISGFGVPGTTIVFVMDQNGKLIAINQNLAVTSGNQLMAASTYPNDKVRQGFASIFPIKDQITGTAVHSVLSLDKTHFVDAIRITDSDSAVKRTYDWVLVMVTHETDLYNLPNSAGAQSVSVFTTLVCLLVAAAATL
eukprot:Rhum_TRINITY_DN20843_c0_g1::Rhum_TRINITY_DN20843_c0_g1_i1::g.172415::m.172415